MNGVTRVRRLEERDWPDYLLLTRALFPQHSAADLESGMRQFVARADAAVFLFVQADGSACGFVEVGSRLYADGCDTSPVGYIEAWYVASDLRRQGVGRSLLAAAERWARGNGYLEMASDASLDNHVSHQAHSRAGYQETDRVVQFRKVL